MFKLAKSKELTAFLTTMMACGAFLVGAVKVWGVPLEKIWSGFLVAMIVLCSLLVLSLVSVLILKGIKKLLSKD